jgi:hypothetical protein
MAPNKKPNAWLQRNAARVRIWVEEGVIDKAEADHLSKCVFDRMTAHNRAPRTSRRVITPYDEGALTKFITTAAEFLAREQPHVPEVGQPSSDPPEPPEVDTSDDREGAVEELRMIRRDGAEGLMEVDEHRYDHPFQWPSSPPRLNDN